MGVCTQCVSALRCFALSCSGGRIRFSFWGLLLWVYSDQNAIRALSMNSSTLTCASSARLVAASARLLTASILVCRVEISSHSVSICSPHWQDASGVDTYTSGWTKYTVTMINTGTRSFRTRWFSARPNMFLELSKSADKIIVPSEKDRGGHSDVIVLFDCFVGRISYPSNYNATDLHRLRRSRLRMISSSNFL